MRFYVDELPECCSECPCCNHDVDYGSSCNLGTFHCKDCFEVNSKHKDCPLRSREERDNYTTRKVVKQVVDFIEEYKSYYFEKRDYYGVEYVAFDRSTLEEDILKHLQGDTDGK